MRPHARVPSCHVNYENRNCYHAVDISAPFGGFKQSGIGREGGPYGLLPYLEVSAL